MVMVAVLTNIRELATCRAGLPPDDAGRGETSQDDIPKQNLGTKIQCP
jgi:hypothetical protein